MKTFLDGGSTMDMNRTEQKTIRIGKPYITKTGDGLARLCADVTILNRTRQLWYGVEERYEFALTQDRSDPFVAAMVHTGMQLGADILCEEPVSQRLLYKINHSYIPALAFAFRDLKEMQVIAEPAGPHETKGAVGCGGSFGVDSLYTIIQNSRGYYPVTHLCLFNAGSFGGEPGRKLFQRHYELVHAYAEQKGMDSLFVDTNLYEIPDESWPNVSTQRFLSVLLALQGLFGTYHYAATFRDEQFRFSESNSAYYDPLTVNCFATDSLRLFLSGASASRTDKLMALADYPEEAARLHPCARRQAWEKNCSECEKCVRDMMVIYAAKKTDRFARAFDFDGFEKQMQTRLASVLREKEDILTAEAFEYWKNQGLPVPEQLCDTMTAQHNGCPL